MRTIKIKVGPKKDKGDKTPNEIQLIREGSNDEIVFMSVFSPDQMARCLEETLMLLSLANEESVNDIPPPKAKLAKSEALSLQKPEGNQQTRNQKHPNKKLDPKSSSAKVENLLLSAIENADNGAVFRQAASAYIAKNLPGSIEEFYLDFVDDLIKHALDAIADEMEKRGLKRPSESDLNSALNSWLQTKRMRLGLTPQNRPPGREGFHDCKDFIEALKQVLSKAPKEPSRVELWHMLRLHSLYTNEKKKKERPSRDSARTLDGWLQDCGIKNIDEAIELYWKKSLDEE